MSPSLTVTQLDWTEDYIEPANRLVKKHGGQYIARTVNHQQLEGDKKDADLRIIIEWSSKEGAINFMNDEEYAPHLKSRTDGSVSHHYLIEGKDEMA